ncbi:MAG: endonuclease [Bacteroidales bacterium]|nr:endonuclease [Bacteroidales bacterium]
MKRIVMVFVSCLMMAGMLRAQAPAGYYNHAIGLSGRALHEALAAIVTEGHQVVGYDELWDWFPLTDPAPEDSTLLNDMYSLCRFAPDQHGDGDGCTADSCICYQREHSFCQSWFGYRTDAPFSDLHHIHPVDGGINGSRGNYPYGEVDVPTRVFRNGSKRGYNSASPDYTGIVYEPIDEYKGDLARMLFYMTTRYLFDSVGFSHDWYMTDGSQLRPWALQMLLHWNILDPVSEKEIRRNNVIYDSIQHNRNPFIDYPDLANLIWTNDSLTMVFTEEYVDVERPHLLDFTVNDANSVTLTFDNSMIASTLSQSGNYVFNRNVAVAAAHVDAPNRVTLTLDADLVAGLNYYCVISNLQAVGGQFIRDTAVVFTYGFSSNHTVLAGWTFDTLTAYQMSVERRVDANLGLLHEAAVLYLDGQYGSSLFNYTEEEDYSDIRAYSGSLIGDPRQPPYDGLSLALQHRANGKGFVVSVPTTLYHNIILTFAIRRTSMGASQVFYEWSTNGEIFTPLGDTVFLPNLINNSEYTFQTIDFQEIDDLEDTSAIFLRVSVDGANTAYSSGNIRFDNICVRGQKCVTNTFLYDTVQQGDYYNLNGFHIEIGANQQPGTFQYVRQKEIEGECDSLFTLNLTVLVGVNESREPQFRLFPNPAHEAFTLEGSDLSEVRLYDGLGQQVSHCQLDGGSQHRLDVSHLPEGLYLVTVVARDGRLATRKLVITR